jgi:hypothetical protein
MIQKPDLHKLLGLAFEEPTVDRLRHAELGREIYLAPNIGVNQDIKICTGSVQIEDDTGFRRLDEFSLALRIPGSCFLSHGQDGITFSSSASPSSARHDASLQLLLHLSSFRPVVTLLTHRPISAGIPQMPVPQQPSCSP